MAHIAIFLEKNNEFDNVTYLLREIAEIWRQDGLRVSLFGTPGPRLEADLVILHVDLTVVPAEYLAFVRQYPVVINGRVADISKRLISSNLVCPNDGYQGPVIVKTNQNYGGAREKQFTKELSKRPLLRKYATPLFKRLPWSWQLKLSSSNYRIFESVDQVPERVWHNPELVVERFLPERRDDYYCLRTWTFLGNKETNSLCCSRDPIIKSNNFFRRQAVAEVPEELRQRRRDLDFDFGKFDYAIVDGRVVLYDVNRTPTLGSFSKKEYLPNIRLLAEGIRAYL